jgi:hypothetical protein
MSDRPTVARPTPAAIRSFDTFGALFAFMVLIPNCRLSHSRNLRITADRCVGSVAVADQIRLPQPACQLLEKFLRNSCVRMADVALSISQLMGANLGARPDNLVEAVAARLDVPPLLSELAESAGRVNASQLPSGQIPGRKGESQ